MITWDENMAKITLIGLLILGIIFPEISFAFRAPASEGHSEFFERCQQGLKFHPQMSMAPQKVILDSEPFCRCAQTHFNQENGDMNWPHFNRSLLLKSFDACLGDLYIDHRESYQWIGSVLFDLWIGRDLEQRLLEREPAGIGHFISLDQLIDERQCVRDGVVKSCFDGSLAHSHQCVLNQVSDPDNMNMWAFKCKPSKLAIDRPLL